jgi:hypothetical protein
MKKDMVKIEIQKSTLGEITKIQNLYPDKTPDEVIQLAIDRFLFDTLNQEEMQY